jgi:branched-chain amino acid transport system ATP-binding protein
MNAPSNNVLEIQNLKKSYGQAEIIRGVSLNFHRGERHAIIGPNGAGKSTFFNLISAKTVSSSGSIFLNGQNITGKKPYEINRLGLSRSFQVTNIFHRMTVFENLRCSVLWSLGYQYSLLRSIHSLKNVTNRAEEILELIGLTQRRNQLAGELSYAEQRSLEIGITVSGIADVILLDEPTAGMSNPETENAIELIRKISSNKTLLIVEHDMSVIFKLADRISVLVYGKIIETGTPQEIRNSATVRDAYLGSTLDLESI